jgi:hypothetical protein
VVAPAATVTELGGVPAVLVSVKATTSPPVGAALEIVTVPVELVPPVTEVGFSDRLETVGAVMVRVAVLETELAVPVIVAVVVVATAVVVIVKFPEVAPAAMVTELGTVALVELLLRLTAKPPVGAAEPMVAVPVLEVPPATLVGETVMPVSTGGVMVSVAVAEVLLALAVMVAVVLELTAVVETVKVAVVAPAATETELGRVALVELLLKVTV